MIKNRQESPLVIHDGQILAVVLSLQFLFLLLSVLDWMGLQIPLFSQFVEFVYLIFVPGIILLGVVRINTIAEIEKVIYAIGLSLVSLMTIGSIANFLLPVIGISHPISPFPLVVTISFSVLSVLVVGYLTDQFSLSLSINSDYIFDPSTFLFLLLPPISIIAVTIFNITFNNSFVLLFLGVVSLIPVLILFDLVPEYQYSIAIWTISLSLLLHRSLAVGVEAGETNYVGVIMANGIWHPTVTTTTAAAGINPLHIGLLPNMILFPSLFSILDVTLGTGLQLVFPAIISITPVILYRLFKTQTGGKTAFFAAFLYMSLYMFHALRGMPRTGNAIFFTSLILLIMATPEIETIHKTFLSLLFAFFLVTSHYGGAYLFGFALITVVGLKIFWQVLNQLKPHLLNRPTTTLVTSPFVLFYIVANLAWYMYTVSGKGHTLLVRFSRHVILNLTEFMDPDVSYTTHALQKNWASDTIQLMKYGYIIMWVFISFGLVYEILKHTNIQKIAISQVKNNKTPSFHPEYLIFSIAFMGIFSTTLLPTRSFNAPRIMITVLVLLAPFFVSGIRLLMKSIGIISRKGINAKRYTHTIVVLFLVAFFLVNTGFVTETVTKDYGPSVIFGKERIDDSDEIREKAYLYKQAFKSTTDLRASAWLIDNGDSDATIYGDRFMTHRRIRIRVVYLREYGKVVLNADKPSVRQLETNATLNEGDYILLGYHNIKHEFMITQYKPRIKYFSTSKIRPLASQSNKIYTTSRSEVYRLSNRTRFQA